MVGVAGSTTVTDVLLAKTPLKVSKVKTAASRTGNKWRREDIPDFLNLFYGKLVFYKSAA
jgi:hypothetical protein